MCLQPIASSSNNFFSLNNFLAGKKEWSQSMVSTESWVIVFTERIVWSACEEPWKLHNLRQNADPRIINIYIYFKPGRIGFWVWPFSVMYAFWLLIVTRCCSLRGKTVNTFEVNLLMETRKKACEGQSPSCAASNCALLSCSGYLKLNKSSFPSKVEVLWCID